jgi:hypothetical protein
MMRNAMLASIVLVLLGGMAGAAALLPQLLGENAGLPLPEQDDLALTAAKDAVSPQETSGKSSPLPGSGPPAAGTKASARKWAERMFTAGLSKDFGSAAFGTQLAHRFPLTNVYAAPVEITGLRLGCGCVTATPAKRVLQPGESTTIDVALDTRQFTGPSTQTVRVGFGPNPRASCLLKVSAVSQTDLVFKPERVGFGPVACGRASVQSIDVEYHGTFDWRIEEVVVPKGLPLAAKLHELVRRPDKVAYRITVTLKEDGGHSGQIRDYIYLKTNRSGEPPVPVMVTATLQRESPP